MSNQLVVLFAEESGEAFHVLVRDYARHHRPGRSIDNRRGPLDRGVEASRRIDLPIVGSRFNA